MDVERKHEMVKKDKKVTKQIGRGRPAEISDPVMISMRISREDQNLAKDAAAREGISMSRWIRELIRENA